MTSKPIVCARLAAGAVLMAFIGLAGCGGQSGPVPVFPARGQVFVNEKPAEGAIVTLIPDGKLDKKTALPNGKVDGQGNFSLSTYRDGDGAPAGSYTVTIEWPARFDMMKNQWEGDKLNGAYADTNRSKLRATIEKKPNELDPIKIKQ